MQKQLVVLSRRRRWRTSEAPPSPSPRASSSKSGSSYLLAAVFAFLLLPFPLLPFFQRNFFLLQRPRRLAPSGGDCGRRCGRTVGSLWSKRHGLDGRTKRVRFSPFGSAWHHLPLAGLFQPFSVSSHYSSVCSGTICSAGS